MKVFVNIARLDIGQLFTESARRGHPCTLDTFLVYRFFLCPPTSNSKLRGHIGLGLSVCVSIRLSIILCIQSRMARDRILKFNIWKVHEK